MQLFDAQTVVHRSNLKFARQRLAAVPNNAPIDAYYRANNAVIVAERQLEWYERLDIDAGIYDHRGDTDEY